jgi:hypothetical protein
MSDKENLNTEERRDYALIEILMRLSAVEKILVDKGIVNADDLLGYIKNSVNALIEHMQAGVDKDKLSNILKASSSSSNKN